MYRHKKIYDIKYTDVDAYDILKLSSLLSFMEESACLSADELKFGYKDINQLNLGFIVANWRIDFSRPIRLGESLEIHTWPLKAGRAIFLRDFEFFSNGKKVGTGTSRWCMIDTVTYSVMPSSSYFKEGAFDDYNTERSTDFSSWKIPRTDGNFAYSKTVRYSDYDHYFHVNNTKYADFVTDVIGVDELKNKFVKAFQITYVQQCKCGERLDFYRSDFDGYIVVEGMVGDSLRVQAKVEFNGL